MTKNKFAALTLVACFFLYACGGEESQPNLIITDMLPLSGPKSTVVTLKGTGFSQNIAENIVTLNDKPCEVSAATTTTLTLTIPAKAGSGNLVVKVNAKTTQSPIFTYLTTQNVSTVAGAGQIGYVDGTGTTAQFYLPSSIAFDDVGNLFVADGNNFVIRKITPAGVVSTFAGSTQGFADGTGTAAQFNLPVGLAFDKDGNLYTADIFNNRIRKISPAGVVTTFAGSGVAFSNIDGPLAQATFGSPKNLAFDKDGNLFVIASNRVRKITPAGEVSTIAGSGTAGFADGTGTAAQFNSPNGMAIDQTGNLFVVDEQNNRIRKISPAGVVTTFAGSMEGSVDGSISEALFALPRNLAFDQAGNLFVSDVRNQRIRKISSAGVVTTFVGTTEGFADGVGTEAKFRFPSGLAFDKDGNLFVADQGNNRIRKIVSE